MNDKPRLHVVGEGPQASAPIDDNPKTFEDLDLKDTQYGDELLGVLDDAQADRFVRIHNLHSEMRVLDREAGGAMFEALGRDIRAGKLDQPSENGYELAQHVSPATMKKAFALKAESDALKATFFYELGQQFDAHDYTIMIRSQRRVVRNKRKW